MCRLVLVVALAVVAVTPMRAELAPQLTATVLATMQPGVDVWMPVSQLIPTDPDGKVYWGSVPIQTYTLSWFTTPLGINAIGSQLIVLQDVSPASDSIYARVGTVGESRGVVSANGWLSGPGQMIYYDARYPSPRNPDGNMRTAEIFQFTKLRASGIGSVFERIYAGTVLSEAKMYLVQNPANVEYHTKGSTMAVDVPAGAVLTSSPQ